MSTARPYSSSAMATVLAALALSGCGGLGRLEIPKEVSVPTPVPCISADARPQRPVLRTRDELLALDSHRRTHAAWADLWRSRAYLGELEAVVEGCSRIPAPAAPPARP